MNLTEAAASELNHQIAGVALITIALIALLGAVTRFSGSRYVCAAVFIWLGVFLALWSDAEIWPRGDLSWTWLVRHDLEALQHKIYALLLLALGVTELLRAKGILAERWHRWSFPLLAFSGVVLLTMHAHGGTSGLPQPQTSPKAAVAEGETATVAASSGHSHHSHDAVTAKVAHSTQSEPATPGHGHAGATMLKIERQHSWMAIAGIAIVLLKFLADSEGARRSMQIAWPIAMASLGLLLVMYRE